MPSMMSLPGTTTTGHLFSQVPKADIPRSQFNRDHGYKTTFDGGYLVPVFVDDVLPGDTLNLRLTAFARLATPLTPFMDNLWMDSFFFFVPNRLVWNNWEKFNGAQDNPGDSTSYVIPTTTSPGFPAVGYAVGSVQDYFGLPTAGLAPSVGAPALVHNVLPLRAYNLIWNQWFRDQNLQNSVVVNKGDGPDAYTDYNLLRRGKRHDYFTSCLPFPQKGPAVTLPLGTTAPVITTNAQPNFTNATATNQGLQIGLLSGVGALNIGGTGGTNSAAHFGTVTGLQADLTTATAATINQLRQAFQIQKLYERDARGGTRYTEIIQAHFGVISDDARLQRPEYLGGGSTAIIVNPIAQTSAVPSQPTPQGNLAAIGTAHISGHGFTKSFTEHGYVIGLISVRADLNYQQGLERMWSRSTRFDFYWPALSHIGEQAVLNKEIYAQGALNPTDDAAVFGYQERFAEYRYKPSKITGQFRSTYTTPLDMWHLAESFSALPTLGSTFIQSNPPISRVIAVEDAPQFLIDTFFHYRCARPMPTYSVPGLIDHF